MEYINEMRTENKQVEGKKINKELVEQMNVCFFNLTASMENNLKPSELNTLHNAIIHIKVYLKNQILLDSFVQKSRIEFIHNKIMLTLNRINDLLNEEDKEKFKNDYLCILVILFSLAEKNEKYEAQSNICHLIKQNGQINIENGKEQIIRYL